MNDCFTVALFGYTVNGLCGEYVNENEAVMQVTGGSSGLCDGRIRMNRGTLQQL